MIKYEVVCHVMGREVFYINIVIVISSKFKVYISLGSFTLQRRRQLKLKELNFCFRYEWVVCNQTTLFTW